MAKRATFSGTSERRTSVHGALLVDADGHRWRAFAPGWRLWLWIGFLFRRVVVASLPGRFLPFVGRVPAPRIEVKFGMPPRRVVVRIERAEIRRWATRQKG